jgi:hypothetical protein
LFMDFRLDTCLQTLKKRLVMPLPRGSKLFVSESLEHRACGIIVIRLFGTLAAPGHIWVNMVVLCS